MEIYAITWERTEYGRAIRKLYDSHQIQERRCNMRQRTIRKDGFSNTIDTVFKDYGYVLEVKDEDC